jgi:hypothetical protein
VARRRRSPQLVNPGGSTVSTDIVSPAPARAVRTAGSRKRARLALQAVGVLAVGGCFLVNAVDPYSGVVASQYFSVSVSNPGALPHQSIDASGAVGYTVDRDGYTITEAPKPEPVVTQAATPASSSSASGSSSGGGWAPPAGTPDPGSAQAIAYGMVASNGWPESEYDCLVSLWNKESGWRFNAYNASSGAYGIPQSLPGNKMASVAGDWETNPATQIIWGLGYITGRYGTPCGAWGHSQSSGWY